MDSFGLLCAAVALLSLAYLLKDWTMIDKDGLNAQVDASLNVMADAVRVLQADLKALAAATYAQDAEAVAAATARLKDGTDRLAATLAAVQPVI